MIFFRCPVVILALALAIMVAIPAGAQGRLIGGDKNNYTNDLSTTAIQQQRLDAAQEELRKVNSDINHLEAAIQLKTEEIERKANVIENLRKRKTRSYHKMDTPYAFPGVGTFSASPVNLTRSKAQINTA
jgi:hypothetical protein